MSADVLDWLCRQFSGGIAQLPRSLHITVRHQAIRVSSLAEACRPESAIERDAGWCDNGGSRSDAADNINSTNDDSRASGDIPLDDVSPDKVIDIAIKDLCPDHQGE